MYRARQRVARRRRTRFSVPGPWPGLVLIAFIVLKLTGVTDWSWWWVLSPIWIGGIVLVLALCAGVVLLRREGRRQMHAWMDYFVAGDWLHDTPVAPRAEDPGGDHRLGDGEGQASGPPGD